MKSLKITLMIAAIFCLTISGTSKKTDVKLTDTFQKVDKSEFKYIAGVKKGTSRPTQEM
ncbi:hypothetical protein [Pontimicrobium sp. SW4]|uniref:Uncharacterized protein n=1 Tax=Pontimicrobium sp. SW4 TaxID=3153519 RepID=A0AAU7BTJ9_9FLAO